MDNNELTKYIEAQLAEEVKAGIVRLLEPFVEKIKHLEDENKRLTDIVNTYRETNCELYDVVRFAQLRRECERVTSALDELIAERMSPSENDTLADIE